MDILSVGKSDYLYEVYYAVVENIIDPKELGRVQVRILGVHSENLVDVPVDTLPWAYVIPPNMFGGLHQGIGISSFLQKWYLGKSRSI